MPTLPSLPSLLDLDAATIAWIALATSVAFVMRGLAGFGSSMIGIGLLSLVLPPARVVPAFLVIELITSVNLLPQAWPQVDWKSLRWVCLGCAVATPLGLFVLAGLDPNPMRLFVSACLLGIEVFMLSGLAARVAPKDTPGAGGAFAVGLASGVLTGAAGIGGPPAVVFYFATTRIAVSRATLIAYLVFTDICALAWIGGTGLLASTDWWPIVAVAVPFSFAGTWLGTHIYLRLPEAQLRRLIWSLLAALGSVGLVAAMVRIAG